MTQVHDFNEQLAYSEQASCEPFWNAVYRKAFPSMVNHMLCSGNTQGQRMGVDRIVYLSNNLTIAIDEKKRRKNYGDIALEFLSVDTTGAPGWIEKDLAIDYLAYAFMPNNQCYLLPWQILRRAWIERGEKWKQWGHERKHGFSIATAQNRGYKTHSVCVPIASLMAAIQHAACIDVSGEVKATP